MILKGISVNQNPPTKDYLWITPKGNTRFWDQSTWRLIGGSGDTEGSGFLSTTLFNTYINGDTNYLAKFTGPHTLNHSFLKIGYNSGSNENYLEFGTTDNVSSRIYYDATHKALRVTGGIYADWVSALGPNGEIGSGGSSNAIDWTALGTEGNEIIHASHIPDLSSIYQLKLPTTGSASTTYAINVSGNASTATSATSATSAGKWTTARTFKIKDIANNYGSNVNIDGSSSIYELPMPANIEVTSLTIGNAKLTFDDSSGVNMLKIDGVSGQTFNGIYSTKAVSALGGNPLNSAGESSGIDWGALGTYDNNSDHKINVGYLDGVINTSNIPDIYQTKLTYNNGLYAISISGNASTATYATSAGSATTATTATKLGSSTVGSSTKGIYLSSGTPTACSYNLQANVSAGTDNSIAYYSVNNNIPTLNYSNVIKYLNDNNSLSKQRRGFQIAATCVGNTQTDLVSDTTGKLSYGDGGPQIVFDESNTFSGQPGALIYTTHDYAGFGSTWHFVSSQSDWNVISKRFHARTGLSVGDDLPPGRSGNSSLWSTLQNYNLYVNGKAYLTNELRIGDAIVKWENGGLHIYNSTSGNTAGIYADWVSALGANPNTGSGSTGDMDWGTLTTTNENYNISGTDSQRHIIHSTFLPLGYIQNNRNYPVQTDSNKLYVNVPWTDNDTTYKLTLNGTQYGNGSVNLGSFFAPTQVGSNGYVLKSNGSGAPSWVAQSSLSVGSASKLATARKTYVTLGTASTTTTRDWSGDTTIPVDGILSVANGGTGANNLNNFRILDKGILITATSENKKDFNDYREKGTFYSEGGYIDSTTFNNMLNKPEDISGGFKLVVENLDNVINGDLSDPTSAKTGYLKQTLYFKNNKQYSRILYYTKDTSVTPNIYVDNWTSWIKNITSLDLGSQNRIVKFGSNTLSNSIIYENNNKIGINNSSPDYLLTVSGDARISNSLIIGTSSSGAKISWDATNGGLKIEHVINGQTAGLYADWISALGANNGGGSGGGGINWADFWNELNYTETHEYSGTKIIDRRYLPINGVAANSGGQTFYAPINAGSSGQYLRWPSSGNIPYWDTLDASDIPNLSASKINSGIFGIDRIPTLSIIDKTSGTLPITRGGTGATSAKGAEYSILSEASMALETDFNDTTRFAIERINPSATNGILCGYRTTSQLWSYLKGKMSSDSAVNISGNAATATKLGTSNVGNAIKPFYLNAGVPTTCDIYRNHYDSTSDYASYAWHKVAYAVASAQTDRVITFFVTTGNGVARNGILKCRARWDAESAFNSSNTKLNWVVNNGIDVNDFVFVWKSPNVELWCKIPERYGGYHFTVLDSGNRTVNGILTWVLCDSISGHGESSYTSEGTVITSTNATLNNNINGTVNGYSIASTVNAGAANRLAYYSSANAIDDATYIGCDGTRLCVGGNVDTNYAFKVTNGRSYTDFYPAADFGSNATGFNARCRYTPSGLNGSNNFEAIGLIGQYLGSANNTNVDCYGIKGFANNDGTYHINGRCVGIQGYALKGNTNYGVQASLSVDTSSTTNRGFTTYLSGTPASNSTNMGINVENVFSAGTNYGIRALVSGATSGTNYAVYASATSGTNNWGIYSYRGKNYFYDSVGIGTTSPAYKLDINGNIHTNSDFYLDNTKKLYIGNNASTTVYKEAMRLDAGNAFIIGSGTSASSYNTYLDGFKIYLRTNTGHSTRLYINEDGNVGIGNTSPDTKLHVSGDIYATGGVTALQAVSSDKRLKKNIKKFNAKGIIDKLNPVSFEWNSKAKKLSDFKDGTNYGLIAQDSDGIIDNLVFDLPNGKGYKGVRYEKLIPILLQAVKEQQKEIDELKQIIKKLKV